MFECNYPSPRTLYSPFQTYSKGMFHNTRFTFVPKTMAGKALEDSGKETSCILPMMMDETIFPALNDSGLLLHIDW